MTGSADCARVIVAELLGAGVRHVVLSPGSRSAPLAYALLEADRARRLQLHVRLDERSGGFWALGLAKGADAPVAVVTTSGTAAGNLHPAVMEAWHSGVPLVAITADRPSAWAHSGANQTTDQSSLFGSHVRGSVHLEDTSGDPARWRFQLGRVLALATGVRTRLPGPVHVNVSLSDPLTPEPATAPPQPAVPLRIGSTAPAVLELPAGPRTVIVAGDLPPPRGQAVAALAARARVPLLAEPSSNARRGPAALSSYRVLLESYLAAQVDRVVVYGRPTLSRAVLRLLGQAGREVVVVTPSAEWIDPGAAAAVVTDEVDLAGDTTDWLARWQDADGRVRAQLDRLLSSRPDPGPTLAAALWTGLGADDVLVVGPSNPARDLDLAPISQAPPLVYANRGLAGIDGMVSTAAGVALAAARPTHALLGDLTLLHDTGGLLQGRTEPRPDLRLVVANDDGGSIFATLEHGDPGYGETFERLFGTPQAVRLEALGTATGARYRRIFGAAELAEILAHPPQGIEIVDAGVDRVQRRALDRDITALAATV